MAKRTARSSASKRSTAVANSASLASLERQVITIAEQLGRIAGTAQSKAGDWLEAPAFQTQLTRIRNRASTLLDRINLQVASNNGNRANTTARERSREKVAAPGKKHRNPPVSSRSVMHSDEKIAKALSARRSEERSVGKECRS